MPHEPLEPDLVEDLERPEAHPEDSSAGEGVAHLQTHISHVYLTPARVVKIRKAVTLSFLDFGTRARRNRDAAREVALNRRLAPDVYHGLAPLCRGADGRFAVGPVAEGLAGEGPAPEHAVVMRRLPEGRDAKSLLAADALAPRHLDAVAEVLARFHGAQGLGRPAPWSPEAWHERTAGPMRANFAALREADRGPDAEAVGAAAGATEVRLDALAEALERRRAEGRAVDGHGDLHLEHVWIEAEASPPLLIDCIEFDEELRRIDAANDIAFLAMDLVYRGREELAGRFLRRYATGRDDFGLFEVVDLYAAYRASVRAKVAALAAGEAEGGAERRRRARESSQRHLALARRLLEPPPAGALVLVFGTVGVGKSRVAAAFADEPRGVVIASDRVRKRLAGLGPTERARAGEGEGLYDEAWTERVYAGLLERATPVLRAGRVAVLDATFARRRHREAARAHAAALGVPFRAVHVDCAESVVRERLADRAARDDDPSDAGPERVGASRAAFEAPHELVGEELGRLRTDGPGALAERVAAVRERLLPRAARGSAATQT